MTSSQGTSIVVVGAGMNGLLSAYYLLEKGFKVEVYETAQRVGGKIQTQPTFFGPRELAANALLVDAEVEAVAENIGLTLQEKNPQAARRYVWRSGKAKQWPLGFFASLRVFVFLLGNFLKLSFLRPRSNELLQTWGFRVLGKESTENLLNPACLGIFGKDGKSLSAKLIYNYFFVRPSRAKGKLRGSVAPVGGMEEFPQKLREYLEKKGVVFFLGKTMRSKSPHPVVIATDWRSAAVLLNSWKDDRALALSQVPGVDLYSANVFYKNAPVKLKPGFGILFPRGQEVPPLGVLFNSSIFPSTAPLKGVHSETWIFGDGEEGPAQDSSPGQKDAELFKLIKQTRALVLQDESESLAGFVNLWPQVLPLYGVELEKVLAHLPLVKNDIYLMGNYLGEIGLNRFFHRARHMAEYFASRNGSPSS